MVKKGSEEVKKFLNKIELHPTNETHNEFWWIGALIGVVGSLKPTL